LEFEIFMNRGGGYAHRKDGGYEEKELAEYDHDSIRHNSDRDTSDGFYAIASGTVCCLWILLYTQEPLKLGDIGSIEAKYVL
jgi:hypothetical protein